MDRNAESKLMPLMIPDLTVEEVKEWERHIDRVPVCVPRADRDALMMRIWTKVLKAIRAAQRERLLGNGANTDGG